MTQVGPGAVRGPTDATTGTSFVEWGAVLAGAVLAAALSFVFLTFGAAIGLIGYLSLGRLRRFRQNPGYPRDFLGHGPADRQLHGGRVRGWAHALPLGRN